MPHSKIIDKVRKLLELADADRGGTEAERDLAMQRASELMAKHNIAVGDAMGKSAEGDVGLNTTRIEGSLSEWQVTLAIAVGGVSFCDGYYVKRARFAWDVTLVGRPDNVAFTQTLCAHLVPWLEQEASDAYKEAKAMDEYGTVKPRSFKMAFFEAAVWRIKGRLETLRKDTFEGSHEELITNEDVANQRKLEEEGINLRKSRKRGHSSGAGHAAGVDAGDRADLLPGRKLN
jgi:hypothetical protein